MERISDFLNSIKSRLSNPFFFSFLFSWLIYNWQIPVGLFWSDLNSIRSLGFDSIFSLITKQIDEKGSFCIPFLVSIGLTLLLPILKSLYEIFDAFITRLESKAVFGLSGAGKISTSKYIELRDNYLKLNKTLEATIDSESEFKKKYEENQIEFERLRKDSTTLFKMTDQSFLSGRWELEYIDTKENIQFIFNSGTVTQIKDNKSTMGHIEHFMRDTSFEDKFYLVIRLDNIPTKPEYITLPMNTRGINSYSGRLNHSESVNFKRVPSV